MFGGEFGASSKGLVAESSCSCQPGTAAALVDSAPVAAITRHQPPSDEQNEVDKPPDPESSKGQELPNRCSRVSQTEAVDAKTPQEEGVEQRGYEVVSGVLYTWLIPSEEGPGTGTLNSLQGSALNRGVFHVAVGLTPKLETTMTKLLGCSCISNVIHWGITVYELVG